MYAEIEYLTWANRLFGTVELNLAKGGVASVPLAALGAPPSLDDPRAFGVLREHVARFSGVSPHEILPVLGTTHALWLALAVLVRPGDEVLVEQPAYEPLWRVPQALGARVVRFERSVEDGFAASASRVAAHLTPRTRAVVVTNLHNPSGVRTTPHALRELASLCDSVGARLLVDEVYAPYGARLGSDGVWGGTAHHVAPSVVAVGGLSKAYGLGALRLGWVIADPPTIRAAEHAVQATLGDLPTAWACLGAHALSRLPTLAACHDHRPSSTMREEVAAWIAARPRLRWHEPREAPFGLVLVDRADDLTAAIERGAARHGVLVAPGAFFGRPSAFRLGWSIPASRMPEALERLDRVLAVVPLR